MRKIGALISALLVCGAVTPLWSQKDLCGILQNAHDGALAANAVGALGASEHLSIDAVVRKVLSLDGTQPNFKIYASDNKDVAGNALAQQCNAERWIFYDPNWVESLAQNQTGDWNKVFVVAHEIGHHMNGDTLTGGGSRHQMELNADTYAAFHLERMGASISDVLGAVDKISTETDTDLHPKRCRRRQAAIEGYSDAAKLDNKPTWTVCNQCLAVSSQRAVYIITGGERRGTKLTSPMVAACGEDKPAGDWPISFEHDLQGLCLNKDLSLGEPLTWVNVGLCSTTGP